MFGHNPGKKGWSNRHSYITSTPGQDGHKILGRFCSRHGFSYIRGWMQMVLAPNDLFSWNNKYNKYTDTMSLTHSHVSSWAMHVNLLCACSHLEAMKGSSSLTSCHFLILSRLSSSPVWAQLTLFVPAWGTRSPSLQNGAPIHRVCAHSLTGIRNSFVWRRNVTVDVVKHRTLHWVDVP